ncbi:MAG: segregation/condensation protein A [Candidatus Aenigmarchaeota archaeon]|nr:segregation/condensation protein A [Candidatus Aenigmarchaeota archaeon]
MNEITENKTQNSKIKAAVFDLDGVLADTEPLHFEAWRIIFESRGRKLSKRYYIKNLIGKGKKIAEDLMPKRVKGPEREKEMERICGEKKIAFRDIVKKARPYKEAAEFAKSLKGKMRIAVVTSTARESAEEIMSAIGVEGLPEVVVTGDDVTNPKPAPDPYLLAAKKLSLAPRECMAFEDTPTGVSSAKAAGLMCIAVPNAYTRHMDFSHADHIAKSFSRLSLEFLERIASGNYAAANEGEILDTIVKGFDWEDVLTSIVVEHGLDPENIDIARLANDFIAYLRKTESLDFRIPARFVLVAAILLSMKVEALLQEEEEKLTTLDTSVLDVQMEAPLLVPPSERRATRPVILTDLISALNKAFEMKARKEPLLHRPAARLPVPIQKPPDIEKRVKELYERIRKKGLMTFSDLVPVWKRSEIIATFLPLLYLIHRGKVEARQEKMFREITIKLK